MSDLLATTHDHKASVVSRLFSKQHDVAPNKNKEVQTLDSDTCTHVRRAWAGPTADQVVDEGKEEEDVDAEDEDEDDEEAEEEENAAGNGEEEEGAGSLAPGEGRIRKSEFALFHLSKTFLNATSDPTVTAKVRMVNTARSAALLPNAGAPESGRDFAICRDMNM